MPIVMPDGTTFTWGAQTMPPTTLSRELERTTTMAIDPPTTVMPSEIKGPYVPLTLEALTSQLKNAEITAATLPGLRAELAERMAAMFPGQKLVRSRKAKVTP